MPKDPHARPFRSIQIDLDYPIDASRQRAWDCLTRQVQNWWPREFCIKPDRVVAYRIEFALGDKIYEDWGDGQGIVWWTIHTIDAENYTFSAAGIEGDSSYSNAIFTVINSQQGAILKLSERVWGDLKDDIIETHTGGWNWLFHNAFKKYVEQNG